MSSAAFGVAAEAGAARDGRAVGRAVGLDLVASASRAAAAVAAAAHSITRDALAARLRRLQWQLRTPYYHSAWQQAKWNACFS